MPSCNLIPHWMLPTVPGGHVIPARPCATFHKFGSRALTKISINPDTHMPFTHTDKYTYTNVHARGFAETHERAHDLGPAPVHTSPGPVRHSPLALLSPHSPSFLQETQFLNSLSTASTPCFFRHWARLRLISIGGDGGQREGPASLREFGWTTAARAPGRPRPFRRRPSFRRPGVRRRR